MPDSMKLSKLLRQPFTALSEHDLDPRVSGLFYDSRRVRAGGAFFALRGARTDGHRFVGQALEQGAVAVVAEEAVSLPAGVAGFVVPDAREALAHAAAAFFADPSAGMPVVGVTGTNGKTTVTFLLEAILRAAGHAPAVFGTINYRFGSVLAAAPHTTPEAVDLLATLADFKARGADSLVMEVSSHALEQHRADGVHFKVGVFTNLTPEHLDYHGDMEAYFGSKKRLFQQLLPRDMGQAVVNIDDPFGRRLAAEIPGVITCGRSPDAAVHPLHIDLSLAGIRGGIQTPTGPLDVRARLLGDFNLENLLCAVAAALALGLPREAIVQGLAAAPQVPGRMEQVDNRRGAVVLVDYAHTGDALEKVLATVRRLQPRRVITVFGCGGDRDRRKRPVMGEVAARFSDLVVVTSDNPRSEDPQAIIAEILPGCLKGGAVAVADIEEAGQGGKNFLVIADRRRAIEAAASLLGPGDLLLVAGKGHEDYQIIGGERTHFDDREELRRSLAEQEVSS